MIAKCVCAHKGQDAIHGVGNRVFNPRQGAKRTSPVFRCSVCGNEKEAAGPAVAAPKKGANK